jgi:hypothetical protein
MIYICILGTAWSCQAQKTVNFRSKLTGQSQKDILREYHCEFVFVRERLNALISPPPRRISHV